MKPTNADSAQAGFTMIEVMVVIAIIAILASIVVPMAIVFEERARENATEKEMLGIQEALLAWYEDTGAFPAALDSLVTSGYLEGGLDTEAYTTDGWHSDYSYSASGMTASLTSLGMDRTTSTADDLVLSILGDVHAREETRDEVATIHVALRNYENQRVTNGLSSLPGHWSDQGAVDGAFQVLVDEALIPDEVRFLTDAWGSTYAFGGTPSDYVTTPNLGSGP